MKKNDLKIVDKQLSNFSKSYDIEQEEYHSLEAWEAGMLAQRERHRLDDEAHRRRTLEGEFNSRAREAAMRAIEDSLVYGTGATRILVDGNEPVIRSGAALALLYDEYYRQQYIDSLRNMITDNQILMTSPPIFRRSDE